MSIWGNLGRKDLVNMVYDIQKAGFWKRLSAWFLDVILVLILSVGIALVLGSAFRFNDHYDTMVSLSQKYADAAGVSFDLTKEEYAHGRINRRCKSENEKCEKEFVVDI